MSLQDKIKLVETLHNRLLAAKDLNSKLHIVEAESITVQYLNTSELLCDLMKDCDDYARYVVLAVIAMGQGPNVYRDIETLRQPQNQFKQLVDQLKEIEDFYVFMGGIVGYHLTVLKLIAGKNSLSDKLHDVFYEKPHGINLANNRSEAKKAVRWAIESMPKMAEIYPLGGAGDRLNLHDKKNNSPLPAALFSFCGFTLLERLIRDLQGKEFLYYKLFGRQITTPVAIMTSQAKNNTQYILDAFEKNKWFRRPQHCFDLFTQILVPMTTVEGDWAVQDPMKLYLKPGGHGILWKAAQDAGVFDRLRKSGCSKVIIRQINNPMAGIDFGLLALAGIGNHENKAFGFASCPRLVNAAEGMDVLCRKIIGDKYTCSITNIEYTEFKQQNIQDVPVEAGSQYSHFPANTNILFADLDAIELALIQCPVPGMLVNMKSWVKCYEKPDTYVEKNAVRLESAMQNIADYIVDESSDNLKTFITYNERQKTLSVIKQFYEEGKSIVGTPVGCFYDLMKNYEDLLGNYCGMQLPPFINYLQNGAPYVVLFHPAMGGIYSVVGQKIRGGTIGLHSEWIMEIAEAEIVNLDLKGSLVVIADSIMGKNDAHGHLKYDSSQCGKCTLINVRVRNRGLQWEKNPFNLETAVSRLNTWQQNEKRLESLEIIFHGNGEFFAENVTFEGNHHFEVADGERMVVYEREGELYYHTETLLTATWKWHYSFNDQDDIVLKRLGAGQ